MRPGVVHALVVGEHHGDQARVARALHVVLAAQRVQARAGLADLAGDGAQRDQAARVVGAVDVLAHAHAPEDHRRLRRGKRPRHLAQRLGRMPQTGAMASGLQPITLALSASKLLARSRMKVSSTSPSSITVWMSALSMATSVSA